ncbi:MAG: amidohydrolase family protein [Nocardioides sp.]
MADMRPMVGQGDEPVSRRTWPRPQLVVRRSAPAQPAVAGVDIHNHLGLWLSEDGSFLGGTAAELADMLAAAHLDAVVNLDGRWGEELSANVERYDRALPGKVVTFCHLDWSLLGLGDERSPECHTALAEQLTDSVARGARGVKVWKDIGLSVRDATGALVAPDDDRVVGVLRLAGELGLPVLIHTADPVAFFEPLDEHNERLDELAGMPSWWFGGPGFPSFDDLISGLHRLVAAAPGTTFIGAHVGGHAEDLGAVGRALTRLPNFNVDTGGRLGELGRQPRAFREFVSSFPDRVLFGTDCFPLDLEQVRRWWHFLETPDEYFDYGPAGEPPIQGNWHISGADLPRSLLPDLYAGNARRLLGL